MTNIFKDAGINTDNLTFLKILVALIAFLAPIYMATLGLITLMSIDFITALIACRKTKVPITSNKASKSIYKAIVYILLLISCFIVDKMTGIEVAVKSGTFFMVIVELFSIGENFQKITGLPLIAYMKKIIAEKMKDSDVIIDAIDKQSQEDDSTKIKTDQPKTGE